MEGLAGYLRDVSERKRMGGRNRAVTSSTVRESMFVETEERRHWHEAINRKRDLLLQHVGALIRPRPRSTKCYGTSDEVDRSSS
jgi:hypothetical protein